MVEESKTQYELTDMEIEIMKKMIKVPKLRIEIVECRWESKTAVEILRDSMSNEDNGNWKKI